MRPLPRPTGFTLVEMVIVVAILAILLTMAAPSFNSFFDKYRVKRAAETVSAFLVNAKSEAIKRNKNVNAVVTGGGSTWCIGMTESSTCDCSTAACKIDGVDRAVYSTAFKGVELDEPDSGHVFGFEPQRGKVTGIETMELESANGVEVHVKVGTVGRIRICVPGGGQGYPSC